MPGGQSWSAGHSITIAYVLPERNNLYSSSFLLPLNVASSSRFNFRPCFILIIHPSAWYYLWKVQYFVSPFCRWHTVLFTGYTWQHPLYMGLTHSTLQMVQNAAARLLTGTKNREHILPGVAHLHWFPVKFYIFLKMLLFIFKALS